MASDVKMKRVAATGSLSVGPARIRSVHCKDLQQAHHV